MLPIVVAAVALSTAAAAVASLASPRAAQCAKPTLVRTLNLKLPGGKASFSGFAAGRTYLVRFSGSILFKGFQLGLADAPGAFTVDALANDVLLSSFPASRLAVAGSPGAYQVAVQLDPRGNALRYGAPPAGASCPALPAAPALPGSTLQLAAAPTPWSGSIRVDVLAYGASAGTSGPPGTGATYTATETGSGSIFARDASKYLFGWRGSDYRAASVTIALTAKVSERLGSQAKSPKLLSGSAKVALVLTRVKGGGPTKVTQPLSYRLSGVSDLDVTPNGQAFDFKGVLTGAGPSSCGQFDVYADPQSGTLDFHVCKMEGEGTAAARITPGG